MCKNQWHAPLIIRFKVQICLEVHRGKPSIFYEKVKGMIFYLFQVVYGLGS